VALIALVSLLHTAIPGAAQERRPISGTVTSASTKSPVSAVSVAVKQKCRMVMTDLNGRFSISAGERDTLAFYHSAFKLREIVILGDSVVDIAIEPAPENKIHVKMMACRNSLDVNKGPLYIINGKLFVRRPVAVRLLMILQRKMRIH
jgi:hypothetical protein